MSNLGLQAVYGWINRQPDSLCERIFWDKENSENRNMPLSVESQRPPTDYAVLAFSLNYEVDYLNIAPFLKSCGIPLFSDQRDETFPLLIAGGPCITSNPMPVAPFFDCLCIGEAEEILPSVLEILGQGTTGSRTELLEKLARVPGAYVPRFPPPNLITRQWVKKLDETPVHSIVLTRDTELSDLYLIEVQRGCAHNCRFCLVSCAFSPMRFHSLEQVLELGRQGLKHRKRLGLVGPAVTDHPRIENILEGLLDMGAQLSISSLRITSLTPEILKMMVRGGLRSVALAPEAGSETLRQVIKKGINENQILEAVSNAAEAGMQQLKLYFMIGLPQESEEDIQAAVALVLKAKELVEKKRSKARLTLNISPFIPKAGTAFQREPVAPPGVTRQRINTLNKNLAHKGIQIKTESLHWSEIQAVLSRGDSSLAAVLADIQQVTLPAWREAVARHSVDIDRFAYQSWGEDTRLPWDIIKS